MVDVGKLHDSVDALLDAVGRGARRDALELAQGVVEEAREVRDELRHDLCWRPKALAGFTEAEVAAADGLADAANLDVIWVVSSVHAVHAAYLVGIEASADGHAQQLTEWRQTLRHRVAHRDMDREAAREERRRHSAR